MTLPFDGAISAFYENEAPKKVRKAIEQGDKDQILSGSYPYDTWMDKKDYKAEMDRLQLELVKLQHDLIVANSNQWASWLSSSLDIAARAFLEKPPFRP
jgi:polyphosphate kinase 2 (PPK2 family)